MKAIADEALVIIPPGGGALAVTIPEDRALKFFTTPGAENIILDAARREIDAFKGDASTKKGRDAIKKFAMDIVRTKTYIESVGKTVAADVKDIPKKVDASRKLIRDTLDAWVEEVRRPVAEWEEHEADRIQGHRDAIDRLKHAGREGDCSSAVLLAALASVKQTIVGPQFEEFEAEAAAEKNAAIDRLTDAVARAEKREAEAAELDRLRKEAAEREDREREERIARAAEERARQDAERKAQEEIERREAAARAEREAVEAKARAEREAAEMREREAERKAEQERLAAERRETELKRQAQEAERRAAETEARLKREAEEAKAHEEEEARRREADRKHRASIQNAAMFAFIDGGLDDDAAKKAVELIAKRAIPNVQISY